MTKNKLTMPKKKVKTSKNVSNTKKQVVRKTRQKAVNVGDGVEKQQQKCCHQCGDNKGEDGVIDCEKCGSNRYCVDCKNIWYPDVPEEEFVRACPVCQNNCNCNTCLHGFLPEVMQGYSCSTSDKIQYSKQLLRKVFPLLKNLNEESHINNEMQVKIKGSSLSGVKLQNEQLEVDDDITCDNCGAYFFGFCRSCTRCNYDLCIACFRELCNGILKWTCGADGSIPCPPKSLGGCDNGTLELKHVMLLEDVEEMLKKAQGIYERVGSDDIPETSTKCGICCDSSKTDRQENSNAYCLYSPSAKDIQGQDMKHFQWHWSKGEPIIVSDVLSTSSGLSWDPMVMWRAFTHVTKSGNRPRAYKVNAVDCSNGEEVEVYLQEFLKGYSEGGFDKKEGPRFLKLENWQPPCSSQGEWPRHFAEFISTLPFKEYTHPHSGYFNLASKLHDVSSELDMGPRMDIAYGVEEELEYGDSVTKLHYDKSDTVNVLTHTKSAPRLCTKLKKKITGKRKHGDPDGASVSEKGDSMVEGALWDIFRRQDIAKLKKYIWNHKAEFKLAHCPSAEKDFFPIHDNSIYLNTEHKRKLKEEFGIEPWTIKQKLGDAVLIPAGCPYQVKNLKSCTKVELNFISAESLGACNLLQKQLRMLPTNHKAKQQMQNIGKLMICALKCALMDLSSYGPTDDLHFANVFEINDDGETENMNSNDLGQEKSSNEWIFISSPGSQSESPPLKTPMKDSNETEGVYRGNIVGVEEKKLLQAFELHYPDAFDWKGIPSADIWRLVLKSLYTLLKGILETSLEDLVKQEQLAKFEVQLRAFNKFGFKFSWIEKRLEMVKELRFGDYPLRRELLLVQQQSVEPLQEEAQRQYIEAQTQYTDAQNFLEKAKIKYDDAKKYKNKLNEMVDKYGDTLVLSGSLGSGMLPGY